MFGQVPADVWRWRPVGLLNSPIQIEAAAADAGIVLPHRRSVLGRWYLTTLIPGERPRRPRPLTRQPPADQPTEVIVEPRRNTGSFLAALAGRTATLAALGLLFYWLA